MSDPETANDPIGAEKAAQRRSAETARQAAHAALEATAGALIRDHFLDARSTPGGAVVAGYWPFRSEIDPRPLMEALHARGHRIVLPVAAANASPLRFRLWGPGATMVKGGLGGLVPDFGAPEIKPDLLLVPMLAYDLAGYRLGYGGGFYDRTLEALRAGSPVLAVGVAYEAQCVPSVPREATDQRLDAVLTETGLTEFGEPAP